MSSDKQVDRIAPTNPPRSYRAPRFQPRSSRPLPPSATQVQRANDTPEVPLSSTAALSANDQSPPEGATKGRDRKVVCVPVNVMPSKVMLAATANRF